MATGWRNSFSGGAARDYSGGQNSNLTTSTAWNIWDNINTTTPTSYDWNIPASSGKQPEEASMFHTLLFNAGVGWSSPDPHMMCLKLGKRHYCDYSSVVVPNRHVTVESSSTTTKRGKLSPYPYNTATRSPVSMGTRVNTSLTRCQVDGCHVALANAKEYYRRHKVCEIHSKAPNVVVSGFQQRFCQQCSRFHDVTEFDEAKRSCRRRLQGHNLRRRKGTLSGSLPRNFPQSHENNSTMGPRLGPLSTLPVLSSSSLSSKSKSVCALSLLSSPKTDPWTSSSDLSSRCSAALYELIAANRATSNSWHFLNQNSSHQPITDNEMHTSHDIDRFSHTTMTIDVKQPPALDFGLLAMKEESKGPEEWTDYCWSAFGGANVV